MHEDVWARRFLLVTKLLVLPCFTGLEEIKQDKLSFQHHFLIIINQFSLGVSERKAQVWFSDKVYISQGPLELNISKMTDIYCYSVFIKSFTLNRGEMQIPFQYCNKKKPLTLEERKERWGKIVIQELVWSSKATEEAKKRVFRKVGRLWWKKFTPKLINAHSGISNHFCVCLLCVSSFLLLPPPSKMLMFNVFVHVCVCICASL